ncbi:MAG: hypothetical protein KDA88_04460 [Planctomycetaceae bacterium]|nr:hypothetical protein [Planctomycetaceae bacterium]
MRNTSKLSRCWRLFVALLVLVVTGSSGRAHAELPPQELLLRKDVVVADGTHLQNLMHVSTSIYSGSEPVSDKDFAELAKLGVRVVLSVDGAVPKVAEARRHGLRYIHVPFGYDGIPEEARLAILRATKEAEGPIYVHCHHGKHRGPAAAAIAAVATKCATKDTVRKVLELGGTNPHYAGLWRDVQAFELPDGNVELPKLVEAADVDSMVQVMARMSRASEELEGLLTNNQELSGAAAKSAAEQSLLLKEEFRETVRLYLGDCDQKFQHLMRNSSGIAERVDAAVQDGKPIEVITREFKLLKSECSRCHELYRDNL